MSFSVNVRLGEVSATTSLSELSASVTISGGLLRSIPFSANKDTELEFADTITFSVDNPSPDVEYLWRVENSQGTKEAKGTQVKQDYTSEGQYDVKVFGHYLNQGRLEGINYQKDFVKLDFGQYAGLLDQIQGDAAAAYSIRLLRSAYSDGLLRVRAVDSNGIDQGEADVQDFVLSDGRYIDLNSPIENLDSIATGRGLSNSPTLGDLVDSGGANYDGFVSKWYDQSSNANHATNSTASEQPKIVNAGSLIKENGKPALSYTEPQDLLIQNIGISGTDPRSVFSVNDMVSSKTAGAFFTINENGARGERFTLRRDAGGLRVEVQGSGYTSSLNQYGQAIEGCLFKGSSLDDVTLFQNNLTEQASGSNLNTKDQNIHLSQSAGSQSSGTQQEHVVYPSNQSSNKTQIINNQNNFYKAF